MLMEVVCTGSPGEITARILPSKKDGHEVFEIDRGNASPGEVKWLDTVMKVAREATYDVVEDKNRVTITAPKGKPSDLLKLTLDLRVKAGAMVFALDRDGKPITHLTGRKAKTFVEAVFGAEEQKTAEEKAATKVIATPAMVGG